MNYYIELITVSSQVLSHLQLMFLRVHMETAHLLRLLIFIFSWLADSMDDSSWSGSEQRGVFITAIVSSSGHQRTDFIQSHREH